MGIPMKLALVLDMILVMVDHYAEGFFGILPIGGSGALQLGTLLIGAVIITEIRDAFWHK